MINADTNPFNGVQSVQGAGLEKAYCLFQM